MRDELAWRSRCARHATDELQPIPGSRRTAWGTMTTLVAGVAGALALQATPERSLGRDLAFSGLYAVGCIAGLGSAALVARIPEPRMASNPSPEIGLLELLREPLADRNFRHLLRFLASWQFAVNLATPFFTVYLVRQLGYTMATVMGLSVASQVANAVALRNWGALSDRFTNKSVLLVAAPAYIACILGMIGASQLTDPALRLGWLVLLHLAMGSAVAGVTLANTNIALKLSPRGESAAYLAASGIAGALSAGIAPLPELPGPDWVLVRVRVAGICGTDLRHWHKHEPELVGDIMGHELAGDIAAIGTDVSNVAVGDRVVVQTVLGCGQCAWCRARQPNLCPDLYPTRTRSVSRAYGQFLVAPASHVYRLPDHVSYEQAALIDTLSVCLHAHHLSGLGINDRIAVIRAGPIGRGQLLLAKASGADVLIADTVDHSLAMARIPQDRQLLLDRQRRRPETLPTTSMRIVIWVTV